MRVVISGMGAISSLGTKTHELFEGLLKNQSHIQYYPEWEQLEGLNSFLGAPAPEYDSRTIPRNVRRCMSRMSEMAYLASQEALQMAELPTDFGASQASVNTERMLILMGSTTGSPIMLEQYYKKYFEQGGPRGQLSTSFFKVMNHSVPANVAAGLKFSGALLAASSACSTSTQAIVLGAELIKAGLYDIVLAGGADELHNTSVCVFDGVHAASTHYHKTPQSASRPFDQKRDGLVLSEGAGVVVLESLEHAIKRSAKPLAEILGGAYFCDSTHMTQPQLPAIVKTMQLALEKSGISSEQVDCINAHATSTILGDREEGRAIEQVFGQRTPVFSLKGHLGHSLAAAGGIELIASVLMMRNNHLIATKNLEQPDPECGQILLPRVNADMHIDLSLNNNFAFGGMNTSVVLKRWK